MKSLLVLLVTSALTFHAQSQHVGVDVNSIRVVGASIDNADVEININNDGSRGEIRARVIAKSKDGVLESYFWESFNLPVGKNLAVKGSTKRPPLFSKQSTDILQVEIYKKNEATPFFKQKFKSEINWEAVSTALPTAGQTSTITIIKEFPRLQMYSTAFRENFTDEEFSTLDMLIDKLNNSGELSESGEWLLAQFQHMMEEQLWAASDAPTFARISRWRLRNKNSVGAVVAEALYFRKKAWKMRGGWYNSSPSPLALQLFQDQLLKAEKVLLNARTFALHNPLWYQVLLTINSEQGKSSESIRTLFDAGVKAFPNYRGLYSTMARHYAPIYGKTEWSEVDSVVQLAVANTRAIEGMSNYAAIYQEVFSRQLLEFSPFDQSMASWPSMKRGYLDLIKRHSSIQNRNAFAVYACRANDGKAFAIAMAQIGDELTTTAWPSNYSFNLCKSRFSLTNPSM